MPPAAPEPDARAAASACGVPGAGEGADEVLQSGVEFGHLCCGGAFLGAEHRRGPGQAEQWAGDVAGHDDVDPAQIESAAVIDAVDEVEIVCDWGEQSARSVEEAVSECGEHPDSAVGAGAAAQGEHQTSAGQCQRRSDGFAEAVTRRRHAVRGSRRAGWTDHRCWRLPRWRCRRRMRRRCCVCVRLRRARSLDRGRIRRPGRRRRCRRRRRPVEGSIRLHRPQ